MKRIERSGASYSLGGLLASRLPRTALSLEVVFVLLYSGVAVFLLLALHQWINFFIVQPSAMSVGVSRWWHSCEASPARWMLCGFSSLIVLWLWLRCRAAEPAQRGIRFAANGGSAVLVLLIQWAFLSAFEELPAYSLTRVYP